MQDECLAVKYISVNTCFAYLPEHWLRRLSSRGKALRCRHNDADYYLSWSSRPGPDGEALCLGATFASSLGLREGSELLVTCIDEPPALTSIAVAPKSPQDREILELQCDNVQSNLLDQIRVVAKDQTIVAWVSKFLSVTLIVKSLEPNFKYGRLENDTEIHVGEAYVPKKPPAVGSPSGILGALDIPAFPSPNNRRVYRVQPLPRFGVGSRCAADEALRSPFRVYGPTEILPSAPGSLCLLRKVKEDRQHVKPKFPRKAESSKELAVVLSCLEDASDQLEAPQRAIYARHPSLSLSADIMVNLRLEPGAKVTLEPLDATALPECTGLELLPYDNLVSVELFRNYVARNSRYEKMLLNSRATLSLEDGSRCLVKLQPEQCTHALVDEASLAGMELRLGDAAGSEDNRPINQITRDPPVNNVAKEILGRIVTECKYALTLSLGLHDLVDFDYERENILISGVTGSGKTTACKLLGSVLSEPPYFAHARFIDCKSLKGKKSEVIQKLMVTEIAHCVYHQPAILFLDDIECITSASANVDEKTPDAMNAVRITDVIFNTIYDHQKDNYISVVATCTDVTKVGKKLREARGVHFFRTILSIPPLEKDERIKILRRSLEDKLQLERQIDWEHYGNKTEGWVAQDLVVLADKAAFAAWKRHVKEKRRSGPELSESDLGVTLDRCTPLSLHGVNLYRGEGHSWSDIGGLADVKRTLVEILHWPLRYPGVFRDSPIKLQSGVLLYGMPGTGKTMLAAAIARECGLNLISVKGPELLSKYIGASEEAVRGVFEKAHRAKPCVVFFDEFDSLAPRRGHDTTGVTDRVVNQLLTHLDGIEGREGVAVVAASSRPDLLDPALLRPGRLDRALLCSLPNETERIEILTALCRMHAIDASPLDLEAVARMTDGFTGADLNAILMQARLDVIEEALESASPETKEHYADAKLTQEHLVKSVKSTKPSLLAIEKKKYNRIYEKFARSDSSVVDELHNQKATLA